MELTLEERAAHILQLESPRWEIVKQEYERMKADHRLTDADIASFLDFRSANTFRNSSAHRRYVTGLVRLWLTVC